MKWTNSYFFATFSYGLGVEIDKDSLKICQANIKSCGLECSVDVLCLDVTKNTCSIKPIFDTVIMNPPFGTKNNAGIILSCAQSLCA